jgi:hypothetical protein
MSEVQTSRQEIDLEKGDSDIQHFVCCYHPTPPTTFCGINAIEMEEGSYPNKCHVCVDIFLSSGGDCPCLPGARCPT